MTDGAVLQFPEGEGGGLSPFARQVAGKVQETIDASTLKGLSRGALAREVKAIAEPEIAASGNGLNLLQQRDLVTEVVNALHQSPPALSDVAPPRRTPGVAPPRLPKEAPPPTKYATGPNTETEDAEAATRRAKSRASVEDAALRVRPILLERIDPAAAAQLTRKELARQIAEVVVELLHEESIQLIPRSVDSDPSRSRMRSVG